MWGEPGRELHVSRPAGPETSIYLALAVILAGLCFLRIRPGRSAGPATRLPRPIGPAPALERSP